MHFLASILRQGPPASNRVPDALSHLTSGGNAQQHIFHYDENRDFGTRTNSRRLRAVRTCIMRSPFSRASRYLLKPIPIWVSRILLGVALGFLAAGTSHGASVAGQVFEVVNPEAPMSQWTRLPSTDAYVIVSWFGTVPRPGHTSSVCLHTAIGKTDEHGRFNLQQALRCKRSARRPGIGNAFHAFKKVIWYRTGKTVGP